MGPGIVLYFRFMFIVLAVILVFSLSYSILSIAQNSQNYHPSKTAGCPQSWAFKISNLSSDYANKSTSSIILGVASISLLGLLPICVKIMGNVVRKCYSSQNPFQYSQPLSLLLTLEKPISCSEEATIHAINEWYEIEQQK
jgi:hypothetical protein